jgi:hypothetical protein
MKLIVFLLFLFLFSGYIISLTSCGREDTRDAGASRAAEVVDEAERTLSIFNKTIAAVVLIGGSLFAIYCVKRCSKKMRRRKTGIGRQVYRG